MNRKHTLTILFIGVSLTQLMNAFNVETFFANRIDSFKIGAASLSSVVCNFYQFQVLGSADVSEKTKGLVYPILQELGIKNYKDIYIKQISPLVERMFGNYNLVATANAIFLDEEFINSLSVQELRAVIGHEGMHIKNRDTMRILCTMGLLDAASMFIFAKTRKMIKSTILGYTCNIATMVAMIFGIAAYRRYLEKCADKDSARLLDCHEGCREFIQNNLEYDQSNYQQYYCFQRIKKWISNKLSSHPLPEERLAYLTTSLQE